MIFIDFKCRLFLLHVMSQRANESLLRLLEEAMEKCDLKVQKSATSHDSPESLLENLTPERKSQHLKAAYVGLSRYPLEIESPYKELAEINGVQGNVLEALKAEWDRQNASSHRRVIESYRKCPTMLDDTTLSSETGKQNLDIHYIATHNRNEIQHNRLDQDFDAGLCEERSHITIARGDLFNKLHSPAPHVNLSYFDSSSHKIRFNMFAKKIPLSNVCTSFRNLSIIFDRREDPNLKALVENLRQVFKGNRKITMGGPTQGKLAKAPGVYKGRSSPTDEVLELLLNDQSEIARVSEHDQFIQLEQLPIGDIVWTYSETSNYNRINRMLPYIIERKTIQDLSASIIDGRFYDQRVGLLRCCIPFVMYLIEGNIEKSHKGRYSILSESTLNASIHSLLLRDGFTVICTQNMEESARTLLELSSKISAAMRNTLAARRVDKAAVFHHTMKRSRISSGKPNIEICLPADTTCPGEETDILPGSEHRGESVFTGSREKWTQHVNNMRNTDKRVQSFYRMLCHVPQVGAETANSIATFFRSPLELKRYFKNVESKRDRLSAEFALTFLDKDLMPDNTQPMQSDCISESRTQSLRICSDSISSTLYHLFTS